MFNQAFQLMFKRHRWVLLLILLVSLAGAAFNLTETRGQREGTQASMLTAEQFAKDKQRPKTKQQSDRPTYEAYQHDLLDLYQPTSFGNFDGQAQKAAAAATPIAEGPFSPKIAAVVLALLIGVVATGWDAFGKFDRFAIATGINRRALFTSRTSMYLGALLGSHVLANLVTWGGLVAIVPAPYFNVSAGQISMSILYSAILSALAFSAGQLLAGMVGRVWPIAIGLIGLLLTPAAFTQLTYVAAILTGNSRLVAQPELLLAPGNQVWGLIAAGLILTLILLALGQWNYTQLSLDRLGRVVMLRPMQWGTVITGTAMLFLVNIWPVGPTSANFTGSLIAGGITLALGLLWLAWPKLTVKNRGKAQSPAPAKEHA